MGGGHFFQSSPMKVPTNVSNPIIYALLHFKVIRSMVNNSPRPLDSDHDVQRLRCIGLAASGWKVDAPPA